MTRVLADTGPLVALINRRDRHHAWAREVFATVDPPVYTCEAVVSEACFLLGRANGGARAMLDLVSHGIVNADFRLTPEIDAVITLMQKFSSIPMSFADACLVRMTELDADSVVVTIDGDFRVYRRNRRHVIPTIMPARSRRP